jgi:UDP-N-acetylmuramate--alanine ligase
MTNISYRSRLFFSGIAGSGVSAIACFMAEKGHIISGSDRTFDNDPGHPLIKIFRSAGITIFPQDGSGIDEAIDLAVFSTAVDDGEPERLKAVSLGIPLRTRPEFLTEITSSYMTIAVSGTSGKSTTSGMLAFLMSRLGLSPNYISGGRVRQFRSEGNPGNSLSGDSEHLIIEACESDGTIVNYRPRHSIILNLALDHHSVKETAGMFEALIKNTSGKVVMNADDENLQGILTEDAITFSIDLSSAYRAEDVDYRPLGTEFSLRGQRYSLSLPGRYNLYNALSCITLLSEIGISPGEIAAELPEFQGIERRFDIHLDDGRGLVIDDYAHNPHKISSMMAAVGRIKDRVCYIFQPHGFGPTRLMKEGYIEAFIRNLRKTDHLILLPIYYAGGTPVKDISSNDLADGVRAGGRSVELLEEREEIFRKLDDYNAYIIFGARDETLSAFAAEIADKLIGG